MSLIGSDFKKVTATNPCKCSECGVHIAPGVECLESFRMGRVQKRVCGEECRIEFDNNYWQERAKQRGEA
jgi:hypothetical protein